MLVFLPVHSTRLNFSLRAATAGRLRKTVMSLGGSVLGLTGNAIVARNRGVEGVWVRRAMKMEVRRRVLVYDIVGVSRLYNGAA